MTSQDSTRPMNSSWLTHTKADSGAKCRSWMRRCMGRSSVANAVEADAAEAGAVEADAFWGARPAKACETDMVETVISPIHPTS